MKRLLLASVVVLATFTQANAAIITQWNFNTFPVPQVADTATGTLVPSIGSGTVSTFNGTTQLFASGAANGGSSDPATFDNSGLQITTFAAQDGTARGVQFAVSTLGQSGITVNWDHRFSNTSSRGSQFLYSVDGSTFTSFGTVPNATGGDAWFNVRSIDLTSVSAVNDNANFAFRILQLPTALNGTSFEAANPTGTYGGGTWRFDMVTVTAVPEPSSMALLGVIGVAGVVARRRRAATKA